MAIQFNMPHDSDDDNANHVGMLTDGHGSDGSDDGFSDASSGIVEFRPGDFAPYFEERDERLFPSQLLFHSHGGLPYPLPVDTPEQEVRCSIFSSQNSIILLPWRSTLRRMTNWCCEQRLNALHGILYSLLGANFVGPVSQILAPIPERRKRVLDICTGTGTW